MTYPDIAAEPELTAESRGGGGGPFATNSRDLTNWSSMEH